MDEEAPKFEEKTLDARCLQIVETRYPKDILRYVAG
jgi:hypothetical protein